MSAQNSVKLSRRLTALAEMVTPGNRVCDVGCDHGFLSIYLVQKGISPCALAMDLREGPLAGAKEHVREQGLTDKVTTRLSNGIREYLPGEADTMICAGMGGPLMQQILMEDPGKTADFKELILQPQSEIREFREFLREKGFPLIDEEILVEDEKFYFIFKTGPMGSCEAKEGDRLSDKFGEKLLRERHPVLLEYLEKGLEKTLLVEQELVKHRGEGANERLEESLKRVREDLEDYRRAMDLFAPCN